MPPRFRLELFEASDGSGEGPSAAGAELEEARLTSFEDGYIAGWDDAAAAQDAETARMRLNLAQGLQDMSFTYAEVHRSMIRAVGPLLSEMVAKVLPAVARQSLLPVIAECLEPLVRDMAGLPVELAVGTATRALVEPLMTAVPGMTVRLVEEPLLGPGQVQLRCAARESCIDLDAAIAEMGAAVSAYCQLETEKERVLG